MPDGAGAGDYAIIGWLFQARDEASPVFDRIQDLIDTVVGTVGGLLEGLGSTAERVVGFVTAELSDLGAGLRDLAEVPLRFVAGAFGSVFGDLASTVKEGLELTLEPFRMFGRAIAAPFIGLKRLLLDVQLSFRDFGKVAGRVLYAPIKALSRGVELLGLSGASAAVRVGELVQRLIDVEKLSAGVGKALQFTIGGPIGLLFKLFQPIIAMLVEGLSPAMETFTAIVKTAFTPLFELAELMAQMFAPMVVKAITPFVAWLETAALSVANIVAGLFRGQKAAGPLGSLFERVGPVIQDIFRALGGLADDLLPAVFKTFNGLVPVVEQVLESIAGVARDALPMLGKFARDVIPKVVRLFGDLLKAVLPIIPPLMKVGVALLENVFIPGVKISSE